jgi:hypothetical protein
MMQVRISVLILSLFVVFGLTLRADDADKLIGAWERVYHKNLDTGDVWTAEMAPSMVIYAKKHYSWIASFSNRHNIVDKTTDQLTLEDHRDLFRFGANSGTYEVSGNVLTIHRKLAKWPCVQQAIDTEEFHFEGDELILRSKSTIRRTCGFPKTNWESRWRRVE